jgi:hypothetical protein
MFGGGSDSWVSAPEQKPAPDPVRITHQVSLSRATSRAPRAADHLLERHRVHALGPVHHDHARVGPRLLDPDVAHVPRFVNAGFRPPSTTIA